MEKEFIEWFEANKKRFAHGQLSEKEIAYSAWLEGQKQALCKHISDGICSVCGGHDISHIEKEGRGLPPKDYVKKQGNNRRISWRGIWDIWTCNNCGNKIEKLRRD